jgi:hypothetical protein
MTINRTILNLLILIIFMGCYNFCFYELLWGTWEKIITRLFYYKSTSVFLIVILIDELCKFSSDTHYQINIICKSTIIANFILFAMILRGTFEEPHIYLFLLNGSVLIISLIILFCGIKYDFFKK